jgi:hypothetical protein
VLLDLPELFTWFNGTPPWGPELTVLKGKGKLSHVYENYL